MHRIVARARFALQNVKKLTTLEHFWKMRSAKRAPDCSGRSICISESYSKTTEGIGAFWEDEVRKMRRRLQRELDLHFNEFALHPKIVKKMRGSEHFWKIRSAICARDCSESIARARFPFQNAIKKRWRRSTFGS